MIGSQITKWNKEDDLNILNALKCEQFYFEHPLDIACIRS